jgi:hypothetical protein
MDKKISILILLIIYLSYLPLCISQETNSTENSTEEDTPEEYSPETDPENPFNKLDFKNVKEFNDSNYKEISNYDLIFLFFYSKSDPNSQFFIEDYLEAANYCAEKKMKVTFGKIDSNLSPNTTNEYEAKVLPYVCLIYKGKKYFYEGFYRTKDALLAFMEKKLNDDIIKIQKLSEINKYSNLTYLLFLSTVKDNTTMVYKSFYNYAKNNSRFFFLSCLSNECLKKYGEDIILLKNQSLIEHSYLKEYEKFETAKINSVYHFASVFAVEPGEFLSHRSIDMIYEYEKNNIFYIRKSSESEQTDKDKIFVELGKEFRKKDINVFTCGSSEEGDSNIADAFSLEPQELPAVVYYILNSGDKAAKIHIFKKINLDLKSLTVDFVKNFINDADKGKIKRDLYSEPMSQSKVVKYVKKIIGKTFDREVIHSKKNFFLLVVDSDMSKMEKYFMRIMRNLTFRYIRDPEKKINLGYLNSDMNEARDINIKEGDFPKAFLYTNGLEKKQVIEFIPKNINYFTIGEVEQFLVKNLGWKDLTNKYVINLEDIDDETFDKIVNDQFSEATNEERKTNENPQTDL